MAKVLNAFRPIPYNPNAFPNQAVCRSSAALTLRAFIRHADRLFCREMEKNMKENAEAAELTQTKSSTSASEAVDLPVKQQRLLEKVIELEERAK